MLAAHCPRAGEIVVRPVTKLQAGVGDAIVRVTACGICGSDLHWYGGAGSPPTVCPGHEIVGEVIAIRGGGAIREGARVAVEPLRACRHCARCRRGDYHLCSDLRILGVHEAGGLAEAVRVPVESLYELPTGLEWCEAVLTEPLAVAVHAVRLGGVASGRRTLVLGAGAIGLLCVVAARAMGAGDVFVTARHPHQANAARRMGATAVFAADRDGRRALAEAARDGDIDVVLETVGGDASTLRQGVQAVAPGGTVVVLGLFHGDPPFPALAALVKEVRIVGSMVYNRSGPTSDFDRALRIIGESKGALRELVTHRVPLREADRAFRTAADKTTGAIKVIVEP
jgi:2-desacetyl-2-hydroxyethyl bacteriochlorophyllide A dehydrogenase